MTHDLRPTRDPSHVSKVSPDQLVERAMIQRIKYVDAFPSQVEGGYSPMNSAKNTCCRVSSSINLAANRQRLRVGHVGGSCLEPRGSRMLNPL
jgi:hypothetical protein